MKKCFKCETEKERSDFHKNKARKDGLCTYCKVCSRKKPVNKVKAKARQKRWRESEKGKEYYKNYYLDNKEKYAERNSKWSEENRERHRELWRKYSKTDKCKKRHKAQSAKRRAQKLNATMDGFDMEIKEIYKNCPEGYHVDHMIPLVSDVVCGLHVPWNLQYLTATENLKKNNKLLG